MTQVQIEPAAAADLPRLVRLEIEAGQLFHTVGLHEVAEHDATVEELQEPLAQQRVWLVRRDGDVAGYVVAEVLDGNAHVAQVSVAPRHGRQGIGRALVRHVEAWGQAAGRPATTLTTFRDVPWNGPYYAGLGYRELPAAAIGPELAATMAHEASMPGIDAEGRCAMVKPNTRHAADGPPAGERPAGS
ncbi:GNAT family N-acetyltransferase [Oryzihumus sp.]|jgi:GNAT superfamily N-acetyltransferase|uniref:GNAT family N-acetyltransferase n=1 Tax=Oryzihumus sp. TaxID=1968903 RepID=UPI002EDA72D7